MSAPHERTWKPTVSNYPTAPTLPYSNIYISRECSQIFPAEQLL